MYALSQWLLISVLSISFLSAAAMAIRAWQEEKPQVQSHILPVFSATGQDRKSGASVAEAHAPSAQEVTMETASAGQTSDTVQPVPEPQKTTRVEEGGEEIVATLHSVEQVLNVLVGAAVQTTVSQPGRLTGQAVSSSSLAEADHGGQKDDRAPVQKAAARPDVDAASEVVLSSSMPQAEKLSQLADRLDAGHGAETETALLGVTVFEDEILLLLNREALNARRQNLILQRLMLQPEPPTEENLLRQDVIPLKQRKPYFYGRIRTAEGLPVQYPQQARALAATLLKSAESVVEEDGTLWLRVRIPLVQPGRQAHASERRRMKVDSLPLEEHVISEARRHHVSPALVMGIIEVESAFKPTAISPTGALGLMQIRPQDAGRDIEKLFNRRFTRRDFFDPYLNVEIGTAYLGLLKSEYLAGVRNARSREYLAIAAYNGGINRVLKHFGASPEVAIARINRLSPAEVYRALRYRFPYRETRRYLEKVVRAKKRYQQQLKAHAT